MGLFRDEMGRYLYVLMFGVENKKVDLKDGTMGLNFQSKSHRKTQRAHSLLLYL
jgi:hypothetical protein